MNKKNKKKQTPHYQLIVILISTAKCTSEIFQSKVFTKSLSSLHYRREKSLALKQVLVFQ